MDSPGSHYIALIAALFALLGLSAFFSVCETAFTSLSRIKLKSLACENGAATARGKGGRLARRRASRARLALAMLESYDRLLSAILIGNTLVNMAASAIATMIFIALAGARGVTIATLVMTALVLVFAEITPKTLAKESPEAAALAVAPVLRLFAFLFAPLSRLSGAWKKIVARLFRVSADRAITEDELLTFVEEARQEGGINRQEEEMIRHAIEFDDITAAEIVTPRADVVAVSEAAGVAEIDEAFARTGFSRLPVYRESVDAISGVILLKDFHREVIRAGRTPAEIVKPVIFATKTMKISRLLQTLQEKKSHMAVLVDEFGGTLGIVTIEDIVEELVGEIWDEHDKVREPLRANADGTFGALGGTAFKDAAEFVARHAPAAVSENAPIPATTLGNWLTEMSGGPPRAGEEHAWRGLAIKAARMQRQRVMEVSIRVI